MKTQRMIKRFLYTIAFLVPVASLWGTARPAQRPQRIISIAPPITEILYALGVFERVIAVSDYCTYPPAVKNLPRVGGWQNASLEKIVSLRPDLILVTEPQQSLAAESFLRLGLPNVAVPARSLADVFAAIQKIGRSVGAEAEAAVLATDTRSALEAIRSKTRTAAQRSVIFVVDRTPGTLRDMVVATPGSFLAELIEIAGGRIVNAPTPDGYVYLNKEALLSLNPELILDIVHTVDSRLGEDQLAVWSTMPELRAVRERGIRPVRSEFILHTSQVVSESAKLLAEIIHPELFPRESR